jgi:hypothetical protein
MISAIKAVLTRVPLIFKNTNYTTKRRPVKKKALEKKENPAVRPFARGSNCVLCEKASKSPACPIDNFR